MKRKTLLLIGASRGLGLAMAEHFIKRDWDVVGTVRGTARTLLHELREREPERLQIETVDITVPAAVIALHGRLAPRTFEMLFVNAGVTNDPRQTIGTVDTDEFVRVMVTNALSPMRVIETLYDRVTSDGTIGVMSSGQGSVANNTSGQREVYRGSKAALNMFMRSFAARRGADRHPLVLMAPGWVRTDLGGPEGRLSIEESVPGVVATLLGVHGRAGLHYLDYLGQTVPW